VNFKTQQINGRTFSDALAAKNASHEKTMYLWHRPMMMIVKKNSDNNRNHF
jgi:hypothetical protein